MLKLKELTPGDKVKLHCREKDWEGTILESYDSEIILLKLSSGYNIGIRESDILDVKVLEKLKQVRREVKLTTDKNLPNIAMIMTGGTISARLDPKTGGVINTEGDDIFTISPEMKKVCNVIKIEKPFIKWSENMAFKDWKILAETTEKLLNDKEIKGVIITHGTDFLHYSAAALSFMLGKLNKPVALTYSQRSIDRGSTDASLNLLCAAKFAVSDIAEVAIIGHKDTNDGICLAMPGTKTRKMHTSRRDAFKVVNDSAIAEISEKDFKILKGFNARNSMPVKSDTSYNDKVALIQVYPGQDPEILEHYASLGYKGIIMEVTGIGHVPGKDATNESWLPKIKKIIDKGVIVCATPQTLYGRVNPKVYENGRELEKTGIIFLEDMLPETAFVKLAWVLAKKEAKTKEKIRELILTNFANEFNERLEA